MILDPNESRHGGLLHSTFAYTIKESKTYAEEVMGSTWKELKAEGFRVTTLSVESLFDAGVQ